MGNKKPPGGQRADTLCCPGYQVRNIPSVKCSTSITDVNIPCPHWEECSAPLCPLDETSLEFGIWFGDEPVCVAKHSQSLDWVKAQKRIAKLGLGPDDGYFNVEMLGAVKQPRLGLKGVSPDLEISESRKAERRWIADKMKDRVTPSDTPKSQRVSHGIRGKLTKMPAYACSAGRGAK